MNGVLQCLPILWIISKKLRNKFNQKKLF
ncbi:MAG: hypothetical protein IKT48_00035 [Anaerotignum sp.]|nr:hypothetical protein [Anaerotignum sp.]